MDDAKIKEAILDMGGKARSAAHALAVLDSETKNNILRSMANGLREHEDKILAANKLDIDAGEKNGLTSAMLDRLRLDSTRLNTIASGVEEVADLPDPVGEILDEWTRPNGIQIQQLRVPIGVIGIIYESRPNVTSDAAVLCLKSGNAVILRGGSDSYYSSRAIHASLVHGLEKAELPIDSIQIVPTTNRAAVGEMLTGLNGCVDVIVPRGGRSLVERVQSDARVPVFAHLEGLCHVYVDKSADLQMAIELVVNAKMRRTGICGSAETLLVDKAVADTHLQPILEALKNTKCEVRGDDEIVTLFSDANIASEEDWKTEYLDAIISTKMVDGIEGAIAHVQKYSSSHTECVIAEDAGVVSKFFNEIDSAILLHNASTQFADGGEFGMGAEIGIATGKMHARGPVGVEQLTSFKYLVRGNGQSRP